MARKKISAMTAASAYTGSNEFYELVQGGNTRQGSHALLKTYFDTLYAPPVKYARLSDVKSASTDGGTFTSGAWQTRTLNTEVDADSIVTLSGNQFTLGAGTYRIAAIAPACAVEVHQARLQNITDGTTTLLGQSAYSRSPAFVQVNAVVVGEFTIAGTKTFELQHRCHATATTSGFGVGVAWGDNEFSVVELWKTA